MSGKIQKTFTLDSPVINVGILKKGFKSSLKVPGLHLIYALNLRSVPNLYFKRRQLQIQFKIGKFKLSPSEIQNIFEKFTMKQKKVALISRIFAFFTMIDVRHFKL